MGNRQISVGLISYKADYRATTSRPNSALLERLARPKSFHQKDGIEGGQRGVYHLLPMRRLPPPASNRRQAP